MKPLISPEEVIEIALGGQDNFNCNAVTEAIIISAQQKFICPVLNGLFSAFEQGEYTELFDIYIKIPLAYYVKYLLLPSVAAQVGMAGIIQASGNELTPVGSTALKRLLQRTKSDADALIDAAIEHIEKNAARYPQYKHADNIKNRVKLQGNILI